MAKHENIVPAEARFPLQKLRVSPYNPRQNVTKEEIIELAESIFAIGLIQDIAGLVTQNGEAEIVAGGRRLRALQYLAGQHPDLEKIRPELAKPNVKLAPDTKTAKVWANTENVARKALTPAQEIDAYGRMAENGSTAAEIAKVFVVTEKHVTRRLALAKLPKQVLDALANNQISLSMAACFTISNDKKHSLEVLEQVRGHGMPEHHMKRLLRPESVKDSDRRVLFVGQEAYEKEGGKTSRDLFEETTLFHNPEVLDKCFAAALKAKAGEIKIEQGWKWVDVYPESWLNYWNIQEMKLERVDAVGGDLTEEQSERYMELIELANGEVLDDDGQSELDTLQAILDGDYIDEQKEFAGALIFINSQGELQIEKGLVRAEDKKAAIAAGIIEKPSQSGISDAPKSPFSQALMSDLSCVATGARQNAILQDPDLVLSLLAFQLSGRMGVDHRRAVGISKNHVPNQPSTDAEGYELDKRLTTPVKGPKDPWDSDLAKGFRAFRKKGMEHVNAELTRFLASLLTVSDDNLGGLIDKEVNTNVRDVWTPTAKNFFGRVSGNYMLQVWCELLDIEPDNASAKAFAKMKKGEKAELMENLFIDAETRKAHNLTDDQEKRVAEWVPECFA